MHAPQYKACPYCQTAAEMHASHCSRCGRMFQGPPQPMPPYGAPFYAQAPAPAQAGLKLPAALCAFFLGGFGIHKFILGYNNEGIIMLLISVLTCGIGYGVMHIIGIVEGILYLTKTDQEFVDTYVVRQKPWF